MLLKRAEFDGQLAKKTLVIRCLGYDASPQVGLETFAVYEESFVGGPQLCKQAFVYAGSSLSQVHSLGYMPHVFLLLVLVALVGF